MSKKQVTAPEPGTQARPWLALVALLLGVSLIVLEGSIVNVLIPTIVQDLGIDRTSVLWVTSIYSLVFAALLITFGVLAWRDAEITIERPPRPPRNR